MPSSLDYIQDYVWRRLGVRKFIAGRDRVNELVEASLANWDHEALTNAHNEKERSIVAEGMVIGVKRTDQMLGNHEQEYGFLWAILLQALVGAIVQILIKWWLESSKNRVILWAAKKELVG